MYEVLLIAAIIALFMLLVHSYEQRLAKAEQPATTFDEHVEDALNLADAQVCGASDGEFYCTLPPHDTELHLDERAGNHYRSAAFKI